MSTEYLNFSHDDFSIAIKNRIFSAQGEKSVNSLRDNFERNSSNIAQTAMTLGRSYDVVLASLSMSGILSEDDPRRARSPAGRVSAEAAALSAPVNSLACATDIRKAFKSISENEGQKRFVERSFGNFDRLMDSHTSIDKVIAGSYKFSPLFENIGMRLASRNENPELSSLFLNTSANIVNSHHERQIQLKKSRDLDPSRS